MGVMDYKRSGDCFFCGARIGVNDYIECTVCEAPVCGSCAHSHYYREDGDDFRNEYRLCPDCQASHPDLDSPEGLRNAWSEGFRTLSACHSCRGRSLQRAGMASCSQCRLRICPSCMTVGGNGQNLCQNCCKNSESQAFSCPTCGKKTYREPTENWFSCGKCKKSFCMACRKVGKIDGTKIRNVCHVCYLTVTPL